MFTPFPFIPHEIISADDKIDAPIAIVEKVSVSL
jgi:hypothetical protein